MNNEEAIDILKNCIADYVIGDFCVGKFCPMEKECKDKECVFEQAIDIVSNYIEELEKYKRKHSLIKNHYISKDKVKDKIEHLKSYKGLVMYEKYNYEAIIRHLEELLEEEK